LYVQESPSILHTFCPQCQDGPTATTFYLPFLDYTMSWRSPWKGQKSLTEYFAKFNDDLPCWHTPPIVMSKLFCYKTISTLSALQEALQRNQVGVLYQ